MPGVRCSQRSDLSAQRPPGRPQGGRGRRWSDGDHRGRPLPSPAVRDHRAGPDSPARRPAVHYRRAPVGSDHPVRSSTGSPTMPARQARPRLSPGRHGVNVSTITENLRQAALAAVQDIPGCRAASVCVLTHGEPRTAAVSDAVAIEVDVAQYTANEGPCLDAARTSRVVRRRSARRRGALRSFRAPSPTVGDTSCPVGARHGGSRPHRDGQPVRNIGLRPDRRSHRGCDRNPGHRRRRTPAR